MTRLIKALGICLATGLTTIAQAELKTGTLNIFWPDVEGGAATLIVTPAGESILIDTGMPDGRDSKRIFKIASEIAGLKKIDYLVTTHFHLDHFGGAAELSSLIPIGVVYDNGIPETNPDNPNDKSDSFAKQIKPYRDMQVSGRKVVHPGEKIPLKQIDGGQPISLTCIGAKQQTIAKSAAAGTDNNVCESGKQKPLDTSDNANSVVFVLKFGMFDFFDGGDLTWNNEAKLVCPVNLVGAMDVFQVDHHGLDISNNPLLVQSLSPVVSIMSNGTSKGCGPETFATLKSISSLQANYQIHKNLRNDSENNTAPELIANLEKNCQANHIQLEVDSSGKSYTVSIPAKNHSRTFQSR